MLPNRVISIVLVCGFLLLASSGCADSDRISDVTFVPNPNGNAPLSGEIRFSAPTLSEAMLTISSEDRNRSITFDGSDADETGFRLPVLGMRPGKQHRISVAIKFTDGKSASYSFDHTPPALQQDQTEWPDIQVKFSEPALMEPGVTFLSLRRRALGTGRTWTNNQGDFTRNWGKVIAIDHSGDVIWWFETDSRVAGIERLLNGNLMIQRVTASTIEIDLMGNIIREYFAEKTLNPPKGPQAIQLKGIEVLHHQPHQMSSGDFLAFSAYSADFPEWYSSDTDPMAVRQDTKVVVDEVIIYDRTGAVKWTWDALDYLDPNRIGYDTFWSFWNSRGFPGHTDWTHGNGLSYFAPDDSVLASFRNQSAILKIDRQTKEIKWLLGRHAGWNNDIREKLLTPVGDLLWPGYSHNPRMTEQGTVIMFDNRANGGPLLAFEEKVRVPERFSRAVEFEIDEDARTVRQIWSSGDEKTEDSCYSDAMGDAWRLPKTDNRLVIYAFCVPQAEKLYANGNSDWSFFPFGGRVVEYNGSSEVFRVEISDPDNIIQWEVYGGFRSPGLYHTTSDH